MSLTTGFLFLFIFVISFISFIVLLLTRKAYLKIDYAGGYILFELKNSNRHRAPGFIKALNKVKDKRKAELSGK